VRSDFIQIYKPFLALLITLFLFGACDSEFKQEPDQNGYKRTLIVYIGRDNNLSDPGEDKISSIVKGWNGQNGNLIIYQDSTGGNPGLMEVYRENGTNKIKTIQEYQEQNSASPLVFNKILTDALNLYPADSYGLIVFSHATGWLPKSTINSPRSIIKDQDDEMDLVDFAAAIPSGYFNFIVFEACFTAGIEVAYELRNKTDYIIGSSAEIISPGYKEIYASSLNYLFKKEALLKPFANDIFHLISTNDTYYKSGTISLIETTGLNDLANYIKINIDENKIPEVLVSDVQRFNRSRSGLFFDFEDYFSRILTSSSLSLFKNLLDDCVIYKNATPSFLLNWNGFEIEKHSGLTTYIPQQSFPYLNEEYKKLAWYKAVFE